MPDFSCSVDRDWTNHGAFAIPSLHEKDSSKQILEHASSSEFSLLRAALHGTLSDGNQDRSRSEEPLSILSSEVVIANEPAVLQIIQRQPHLFNTLIEWYLRQKLQRLFCCSSEDSCFSCSPMVLKPRVLA